MKRNLGSTISSRSKKVACTVSAAALMLGVSSAATIGLHFQCNYGCGNNPSYTGYPVTLTAFGVDPANWENLLEMPTSYGSCSFTAPGYNLEELIDTTTSTNGLNPLANGSITVNWFANCANFTPFEGYQGIPPQSPVYIYANGGGFYTNTPGITGEQEVYATFLRDGINYGPNASGSPAGYGTPDNPLQAYYSIDVTGLKSLFTNTPFVVELMASADSMNLLTNAFVTDVGNNVTNSVSYPNTPPVDVQGDGGLWQRGIGGGLSTGSGVFSNTDHIHIASNIPQHGGTGAPPSGFDNAGTISGFILTDKPVVTMSPQTLPIAGPGDSLTLSAYAIGVPPLALQWRVNGTPIPGATNLSYGISNVNLTSGGNYDLVVSNAYGSATSKVSTVTVDKITQMPMTELVYDSNPSNAQHNGINIGATWSPSNSDGTITRNGVMSFNGADTNGITVSDAPGFDGPTGTVTFWMRAAVNSAGSASIFCRPTGTAGNDFIIAQNSGAPGSLSVLTPQTAINFTSTGSVGDDKWHFIALAFDQTAAGGAELFIDGNLDTTNANGSAWSWTQGQPIQIGYSWDPTWVPYNGLLSDVRYYDTNVTASQIKTIYMTGSVVRTNRLQMELEFQSAPQNGYILNWLEPSAVLQSAPSLDGPWSDVNGAVAPYLIVPVDAQQYFRYQYVPAALVSNPFLM
jgi:hypothetical protein